MLLLFVNDQLLGKSCSFGVLCVSFLNIYEILCVSFFHVW